MAAITEASEEALDVLLESGLVDVHAEDEINERNCLHEAAISGRDLVLEIALRSGVDVSLVDVYGRIPLHYACMHGHVRMVQRLLERAPLTIDETDNDNFTPLIHGIAHHQLACVDQLLTRGARIDPESDADHVPLNLACQHGSGAIIQVLLERQAQILPDTEGLFPQHLVARSGIIPEALLTLEQYGADLNQRDKLYQWTPLLHAASEGHVECIKTLLGRNVNTEIPDEKGLSAIYYATWEGHLECMKLLSSRDIGPEVDSIQNRPTGQRDIPSAPLSSDNVDVDGIPDLSLPPPIIPLRRYGHNFLDTKTFIQLSFDEPGSDAISFYHDSKYPAARLTISSKVSDIIPRNIMLPIQEDSRIVSFQIDHLESFTLDLDIFPTFGSKVIGRSVALPSLFRALKTSSGHCCLPLFDPRLRAIGQISFNFQVIKPFHGTPLEITHFATYWKATSQLDTHPSAFITGSSLTGEYLQVFVQLTGDGVPVIYPRWSIDHYGIEVPVGRLSLQQFTSLRPRSAVRDKILNRLPQAIADDIPAIHEALADSFITLEELFQYLPTYMNVDVQVLYPTPPQEQAFGLSVTLDINNYADTILNVVFNHARMTKEQNPDLMRSIVFTSYNVDICTALNWKQPNCETLCFVRWWFADENLDPVLLCNDLGTERDPRHPGAIVRSNGHASISVKEAVRIAQSNNFMGLMCNSRLLVGSHPHSQLRLIHNRSCILLSLL